jgi:integrase/recombinase XerD
MKQAKVLNEKEYQRLLSVARDGKYGVRDVCIVQFSFLLGLRVMEIASINLDDVVNEDGSIKDSFYLTTDQSKGKNGDGQVYLSNKSVRKTLAEYLRWRDDKGITGSRLFWTQKGGCFTPSSLQVWFGRLYDKAGLTGCSSHSGRRTFATNLIQKGFDIKSVSVLMRHKNIQTTSRYIQHNPVMLSEMVRGL